MRASATSSTGRRHTDSDRRARNGCASSNTPARRPRHGSPPRLRNNRASSEHVSRSLTLGAGIAAVELPTAFMYFGAVSAILVSHIGERRRRRTAALRLTAGRFRSIAVDLVIDVENAPGALAQVAAAISDAGVNIAAATCVGAGERAELHILVPHAEAAKHSLAISGVIPSRVREVVVIDVEDRPGVLADLTRRI